MYFILGLFLVLMPPQSGDAHRSAETDALVHGVERTFAQMNDLNADFIQVNQNALNRNHQASGHLYLMRPRKMRWEYRVPEEELFVSDGKTVYAYFPGERQVNKEAVKETFDERMPLMFLLGKSNLSNAFRQFAL